jgi:transglutaminase-like putative cysteine protease
MANSLPTDSNSGYGFIDHPVYGSVRYTVEPLSLDPDTQIAQTIERMHTLVREDAASPVIQREMREIRERVRETGQSYVEGVFQWVKGRLRFQKDEVNAGPVWSMGALGTDGVIAESLVRPVDMANLPEGRKVGDCDDYSMYTASLLEAAGIPWKFATVAANAQDPEVYSHVYVVAYPNGQRIPLDTSHGAYVGWEAPRPFRKEEWGPSAGVGVWLLAAGVALAVSTCWMSGMKSGSRN